MFISHTVGATILGGYALFVAWLGILAVFTVPGLEGTVVFFLPRYENDLQTRRRVVSVCLWIAGSLSTVAALLILTLGDRVLPIVGMPPRVRTAFAFTTITFSLAKLFDAVFLGMGDAAAMPYYNAIRTVLRLVLCAPIFFFPSAGWTILLFALVAEGVLTLLLRIRALKKEYPGLIRGALRQDVQSSLATRNVLVTSAPMFGISLTDSLYPFLDKVVLGAMVPLELVGIYRVAESIAMLNSTFVSPFTTFWPYISKLYHENRMPELADAYRIINLSIIALMLPFFLALIEVSKWALSLFGPEFAAHGQIVLLILAFGFAVDAIAGPAGAVLKMTKHSKLSLMINTVLLVIYCALSYLLTRRYGVVGIASARTAVMVAGNLINVCANFVLLKILPYGWKHAALLGTAATILAVTWSLNGRIIGSAEHFLVATCEVAVFGMIAFAVLNREIHRMYVAAQNWLAASRTD